MDLEDLNAEAEKIRQRQTRFGETQDSKLVLEQLEKIIEIKEKHKGVPEYELGDLLVPIPTEEKQHFMNMKQKLKEKWKAKKESRKKQGNAKAEPGKWWQKSK